MNLSNRIDIVQSQNVVITTKLKQSLDILNMSNLELEEKIKNEIEENPLLEMEYDTSISWHDFVGQIDKKSYRVKDYNSEDDINLENIIKYEQSLYDYLKIQLSVLKINRREKQICEYIIDSLDKDGYLRCNKKIIIDKLRISYDDFYTCLKYVQKLEPSGIGARNLKECLMIQMKNNHIKNKIVESIILEDLDLIEKNKIKLISRKYKITLEECLKYIKMIKMFNPKPGVMYSNEKTVYVCPDVIVKKVNNELVAYANHNNFHLYINNYYKNILNSNTVDSKSKEFIENKLNSALNILRSVEARKSTILKIAQIILKEQKEFFYEDNKYIKPMKQKDVAYKLGYHESTISRGINNKYMLTPKGLFEFKYFFCSSISTKYEGNISSREIKSMIKNFINKENKLSPLSDDKICKLLSEKGIIVARRTVAKYREEMNIMSSFKRKQFI